MHASVLDFSHIRDTPSPNWALLPDTLPSESDRLNKLLLTDIEPGSASGSKEFQSLLNSLLPL